MPSDRASFRGRAGLTVALLLTGLACLAGVAGQPGPGRRQHDDAVRRLPLAQGVNLLLLKSSILPASASRPGAPPFFHQEEMSSILS